MSATDSLLSRAFAAKALLTAKEASDILGLDEKTFRALAEAGAVRSVLVGQKTRRFAESDLRAFLSRETVFCPSIKTPEARTGNTTSNTKVVGFTAAREQRRKQKLRR